MRRSYTRASIKKDRVYSVTQLAENYSVSENTISNWVGEGLAPSDTQTPYRFRGAVVKEFHNRKRLMSKWNLRPGQFFCRRCQTRVFPHIKTVEDYVAKNGKHMYSAKCSACSGKLQKISAETDRDLVEDCRNPKTPTKCLHEGNTSTRGDIGTNHEKQTTIFHTKNDRIIHKWQIYANGYAEKTIDKHLAAIRFFETALDGKPFEKLSTDDVALVRDELKRRAGIDVMDSMSASSIRHWVSHLSTFFDWLLKQNGYKRLPGDLGGYLKMPRAVLAQSAQVAHKEFPTISEAKELLIAMPSKSLVEQRARAIFALAFLGALRADTLVSLRIKHFDIQRKLIIQDASLVRTKAGKSLDIFWFPIPIAFESIVVGWVKTLQNLGLSGEDALFPDTKHLRHRCSANAAPIPVMATTHAVTDAFAVACQNSDTKYTPHAAKHSIGAERGIRQLSQEERKAWSLNMGHENEQTTERHYGKMSDGRRHEVLENIGLKKTIDPRNFSDSQKARMFDTILEAIVVIS
jgi:integrase